MIHPLHSKIRIDVIHLKMMIISNRKHVLVIEVVVLEAKTKRNKKKPNKTSVNQCKAKKKKRTCIINRHADIHQHTTYNWNHNVKSYQYMCLRRFLDIGKSPIECSTDKSLSIGKPTSPIECSIRC
jgi:hypothetical protein